MYLDEHLKEKIDAMALLLDKSPKQLIEEALELYLKVEREKQLEQELEAHKKETNLSYDEFWGDLDFDD